MPVVFYSLNHYIAYLYSIDNKEVAEVRLNAPEHLGEAFHYSHRLLHQVAVVVDDWLEAHGRPEIIDSQSLCGILSVFPKRNPLKRNSSGGLMCESDDDLLSRTCVHYHWRGLVSRSCSGWEGVVPRRYVRQTVTCTVRRTLRRTSKKKKCVGVC